MNQVRVMASSRQQLMKNGSKVKKVAAAYDEEQDDSKVLERADDHHPIRLPEGCITGNSTTAISALSYRD